mgnify:CR=1 FL=1
MPYKFVLLYVSGLEYPVSASEHVLPLLRNLESLKIRDDDKDLIVLRDPTGISDQVLGFTPDVIPLLFYFDGERTIGDVITEIENETGVKIQPEDLENLVQILDDSLFLHNDRFNENRLRMEEEFRRTPIRPAILSGSGYPEDPAELTELLNHFLESPEPDDFEPEPLEDATIQGLIVPHIDFYRGGPSFGRAYRVLKDRLESTGTGPILAIVLGVGHQGGFSPIVIAEKDFETPLGILKYNREAVSLLRQELGDEPFRELWIHKNEHSVELQVIWLQHLFRDREITFVPVLVNAFEAIESDASGIRKTVQPILDAFSRLKKLHPERILWIGSVDLSHIGPHFGDEQIVTEDIAVEVARTDMIALDACRAVDAKGWWNSIAETANHTRICGLYSLYLLLEILRGSKGVILDYQQAISGHGEQMVTFTSAAITTKTK